MIKHHKLSFDFEHGLLQLEAMIQIIVMVVINTLQIRVILS